MTALRTFSIAALLAVTLVSVASSAPAQGVAGVVTGRVTRTGTSEGIGGVKITLASGPVDPIMLRALSTAGQTIGFYIPGPVNPQQTQAVLQSVQQETPGVSPEQLQQIQQQLQQQLQQRQEQRDDQVLQSVFDSATSQGLSPGSAALTVALNNFRDQTAKFRTVTDGTGAFSIGDVPPGQYTVRAERDGYFSNRTSVASITVGATATAPVVLSMIPGATVGGTIRDEDGEGVANATVQILSVIYPNGFPSLGAAVTTKTNFRGEYRLFWMPAGDYFVGASREVYSTHGARTFYPGTPELTSATMITLKTGESLERVDFVLRHARMVTVSGEVTSSAPPPPPPTIPAGAQLSPAQQAALAAPRPNIALLGLLSRSATIPDASENPIVAQPTLSPNRAEFEFTAPPGAYDFAGVVPSGGFGRVALDVGDQDLRGVSLSIQPPVNLKGTITVNGATPDLSRVRPGLQPDNRLLSEFLGFVGNSTRPTISADGTFTLPAPVGTRARISLGLLPPGLYIADVRQDGMSVFDAGFEIGADPHPIQVVVNTDGGTIKGSVQDASGKPLRSASVALVPAEGRRQNRSLYRSVGSDATGRFTLTGVAPGEYTLFAWPPGVPGGSFYNPTYLKRYEDRGKAVTVGPSATLDVEPIRAVVD
jgi:Carboxypeptidase regulatory-like domain